MPFHFGNPGSAKQMPGEAFLWLTLFGDEEAALYELAAARNIP